MTRPLSQAERDVCTTLLEDAAILIDTFRKTASPEAKTAVSCRMVIRMLGDGSGAGIPMGATQGSMSALGYSQSWTIGNGGGSGELYLSRTDKTMLGAHSAIGSYSPVEGLVRTEVPF